jgi:hypothetical protein
MMKHLQVSNIHLLLTGEFAEKWVDKLMLAL